MINYEQIIEELEDEKIMELLDSLEIPYKDSKDYILMPTVCHNEDIEEASWKLYYYKDTHLFMCYTECGGMNIFSFLKHFYETRDYPYDWNKDILQVVLQCSAANLNKVEGRYKPKRDLYKYQKNLKSLEIFDKSVLNTFVRYYPPEWLNDNISTAAMDKYDIRYSISQNKIIIPHFNINGDLIGIRGRALNEYEIENFGKYMPVQIEGKWYSHPLSLNLYGLDKNWKNIKKDGIAFIFESEKSVLQCESFEMKNYAVASCGSNLNKFQINLLMKHCVPRYVVLCYDNEENPKETKYFQKLWNMCKKYSNYCNISFVYDRDGLSKLKDSPSDNGEKIFRKLLEERIIVK